MNTHQTWLYLSLQSNCLGLDWAKLSPSSAQHVVYDVHLCYQRPLTPQLLVTNISLLIWCLCFLRPLIPLSLVTNIISWLISWLCCPSMLLPKTLHSPYCLWCSSHVTRPLTSYCWWPMSPDQYDVPLCSWWLVLATLTLCYSGTQTICSQPWHLCR